MQSQEARPGTPETAEDSNATAYRHCCLSYDSVVEMEELLRRDRLLDPVRLAVLDLAMQDAAGEDKSHNSKRSIRADGWELTAVEGSEQALHLFISLNMFEMCQPT